METLFIYLIKSSGLIGMFYLSYFILLRKETFFNSNRWYLLSGLITSTLLPLLVFTKIVWVDPAPSNFDWSKISMTTTTIENKGFEINWYLVFAIVYSIGIVVFLIKLAFDFYSLSKVLKGKTIQQQADFKFIDVTENIAPFSYFNSIVYNSSLYSKTELENILEHEKIHSEQNHTADVLISRLFCIIFWFNPLIWLYKKAITQNLEFIADSEASKKISDKKAYQLTLLKITTQENCVAITNHFYQSLIKKRIVMLNKNQSKKSNSWKYVVVLPALIAFVLLFQIEVVAQEKATDTFEIVNAENNIINFTVTKKTTDKEIKDRCKQIKKTSNIDLTFSNITRNTIGEIINIESQYKDNKGGSGTWTQTDNIPIKPFRFFTDRKTTGYASLDVASLSKGKEIYINGGKSTEEDLTKLVPNEIEKMEVNSTKNTIKITAKKEATTTTPTTIDAKQLNQSKGEKTNNSEMDIFRKSENDVPENTTKSFKVEQTIIIVNGIQMKPEFNVENINPDNISSVKVFKGKIAEEKTGIAGKSLIEITTKDDISKEDFESLKGTAIKTQKNNWIVGYAPNGTSNAISRIIDDKKIDYKKAVILIDGKQTDYKTLEKLNPNHVERVIQADIKNATEENKNKAIQLYGKKALNGFIQIETKTYENK